MIFACSTPLIKIRENIKWSNTFCTTMLQALFWIYAINALFLILHEIESAYWKEWELFKLGGGITGFVVLHIPII